MLLQPTAVAAWLDAPAPAPPASPAEPLAADGARPATRDRDLDLERAVGEGWSVHCGADSRLYYCNHVTHAASWLPPARAWQAAAAGLGAGAGAGDGFPYGWERATDADGRDYFINHLNKTTTYEDPRKDWAEEPPQPRLVQLRRHAELGFGFVAGSEKPVIVRFVTEGGPSEDKLQPGDQILSINGEDVARAPRDHVIQLVRACRDAVRLTVCQPPLDNSARKSALLSAAKKAKLRSHPSRVRFAEGVVVNGSPLFPPSTFSLGDGGGGGGGLPCMPNVLKVFLENGQTKSFKYDAATLVRDVGESLAQKLCLRATEHFSLVVEHVKSLRRNKLTLLDPEEPLARVAARPGAHNLRCLFRVAFVPKDACDLAQRDLNAFEYLYMQCCNDVVQERYAPELKYDIALRLAALHIHQHAIQNNMAAKVTVKAIEREFGLERFVPVSLMGTMKRKELRKLIGHFLKLNHSLSPSGHKSLTSLQAKLYYLKIINIEQMSLVTVSREDELSRCVRILIPAHAEKELVMSLEDRDAEEFVLVLQGYFQVLTGKALPTHKDKDVDWCSDTAPPYHSQHQVVPARWSYASKDNNKHYAVFTMPPPYHPVHANSNGHIPSQMKQLSINTTHLTQSPYTVDNNMNNMPGVLAMNGSLPLEPEGERVADMEAEEVRRAQVVHKQIGFSNTHRLQHGSLGSGFDIHSMVSMEILEGNGGRIMESPNEEVLRRVAEMQALVTSSEQYLTEQRQLTSRAGGEESDSEGSHVSSSAEADTPAPGELKHSDSLLLLTQGQKLLPEDVSAVVQTMVLTDAETEAEAEPSESDTDSLSTPTNSPSHHPNSHSGKEHGNYKSSSILKPSDSSFGLHSPDNLLPIGYRNNDHNIQDLLKRLQEDNTLPYNFAEGTLYLDPDIIDLTMIPPPITPDEDGVWGLPLPPPLSLPPTPFADHSPLEMQLQEAPLIDSCHAPNHTFSPLQGHDALLDSILARELQRGLVNGGGGGEELEAFLARVAVPPPPPPAPSATAAAAELTPEEIMAFIIPPPPPAPTADGATDADATSAMPPLPAAAKPCIEYATVPRKGGAFSCCAKYNATSPKNASAHAGIQPPPRSAGDVSRPPARPPKGEHHFATLRRGSHHPSAAEAGCGGGGQHQRSLSLGTVNAVPAPVLPPRGAATAAPSSPPAPPPHWPPPKKPPLPPGPSQDVLRRASQRSALQRGSSQTRSSPPPPESSASGVFARADTALAELQLRLDAAADTCARAHAAGGGVAMDEAAFQAAKERLATEARLLVSASKRFVRAASAPAARAADVAEALAACVALVARLATSAGDCAAHATAPLQTRNLVGKARDVAAAFRATAAAAAAASAAASAGDCPQLLSDAEALAAALATLLRSLRVFSP